MENEIKELIGYMKEQKEKLIHLYEERISLKEEKDRIDDKDSGFYQDAEQEYNDKVTEYDSIVSETKAVISEKKTAIIERLEKDKKAIDKYRKEYKSEYIELSLIHEDIIRKREQLEGAQAHLKWLKATLPDTIEKNRKTISEAEARVAELQEEFNESIRIVNLIPEGKNAKETYLGLQEKIKSIEKLNMNNLEEVVPELIEEGTKPEKIEPEEKEPEEKEPEESKSVEAEPEESKSIEAEPVESKTVKDKQIKIPLRSLKTTNSVVKDADKKIGITFNADSRTYTIYYSEKYLQEKYAAISQENIKLDDIIADENFKVFNEKFINEHGEIQGLDPYMAYIINKSDIEYSNEILGEYVDAMNGEKEVGEEGLDLLEIKYNMSGIYGNQYPLEVSDELMSYANAHKNINCATVNKDRITTILEKHKILRKVYRAISNIKKPKDKLLLPEPEPKNRTQDIILENKDKNSIDIPKYSKEAMYVLEGKTSGEMMERYMSLSINDPNFFTKDEHNAIQKRWKEKEEEERQASNVEKQENKESKKEESKEVEKDTK